ncbi:MAG TPA: hypothetical protein VG817_11590 [Gemmatimonadales bacterium]|nr:hypothetical protein [Gemmatimonadales bacterium]
MHPAGAIMRHLSRRSCLVLVLIGLAAPVQAARAQRCGDGQLSLAASGSLTLPPTFGIMGVDAAPDGRLTLWSPNAELLLVDASRRLTTYQLPDTIAPAGVVPDGGDGFRLIDTRSGREMLARKEGTLAATSDRLLHSGELLERAVPWGDGWILGLVDTSARQYVVRHVSRIRTETWFRSATADSVDAVPRYTISAGAGGVLLSLGSAPFTVRRLDPATRRFVELPLPLAGHTALVPADSLKSWRSISTVALDCSLLLTLSDLTSDRRILVRYGPEDQVVRVTPVDAPLGLVARIPGTQTVLAARRAGELELVWYDWRWVREPGSAGH